MCVFCYYIKIHILLILFDRIKENATFWRNSWSRNVSSVSRKTLRNSFFLFYEKKRWKFLHSMCSFCVNAVNLLPIIFTSVRVQVLYSSPLLSLFSVHKSNPPKNWKSQSSKMPKYLVNTHIVAVMQSKHIYTSREKEKGGERERERENIYHLPKVYMDSLRLWSKYHNLFIIYNRNT